MKDINYEAVKSVFNNEKSFECQLSAFFDAILLPKSDISQFYEPVLDQLEKLFQPIFNQCRFYTFGSFATGLGFRNCDLDISFSPGLPISAEDSKCSGPHVVPSHLLLKIVENKLKENPHLFSKVFSIPQARVPIVKFVYKPTNVSCDISFKNKLGVYNSRLIHYYFPMDSCFRSLILIIKYWLHNCESISTMGITNYALTLMVMFYLQQLKLVPPVLDLKRRCSVPVFINNWQVNFNSMEAYSGETLNYKHCSIPELVLGFFEFYANYDFENNVICVIDGHSHDKILFSNIDYLPLSMVDYKEYLLSTSEPYKLSTHKPICIQDPIELNFNVTNNISINSIEKFKLFCSVSLVIAEGSSKNKYKSLLQNIFSLTHKPIIEHSQNFIDCFSFPISCNKLSDSHLVKEKINTHTQDKWVFSALEIIDKFLCNVLSLQIETMDDELFCDEGELKENYLKILHCRGTHCLWSIGRERVKFRKNDKRPLEREIEMTKKLLRSINVSNEMQIVIDFECRILRRKEPNDHMFITIINKGGDKVMFSDLACTLPTKMTYVIEKTLNLQ